MQQARQCRVPEDVVDTLTTVLLALQPGETFRGTVGDDDFVGIIQDHSAVRHRVRGFANLLQQARVIPLVFVAALSFIPEPGEDLLPDALAGPELIEIPRVQ